MIKRIAPSLGGLLSLYGFYQGVFLSHAQFIHGGACPELLFMPACYIVAFAYALMSLGWISRLFGEKNWTAVVFFIGFTPAFILAIIGSVSELFGFQVCPHLDNGFPKCVISLIILLAIYGCWKTTTPEQNIGKGAD